MNAKANIRRFLLNEIVKIGTLRDDESFWETRAIDSLGILQLIHYLESTFGINVPGRDVTSKTFHSIDSVYDYVAKRMGTSPS